MTTSTSTRFVSAAATGENWRDISKKVLEQLESTRTDGFRPNIGFLYMTDELAAEAGSILTLFRAVTEIRHWTGCAAFAICGGGQEYMGVPAISVMIGEIPPEEMRAFDAAPGQYKRLRNELEPWLNRNDPMLVVIHADALSDAHPAEAIEEIEAMVGGFMVGGLASGRTGNVIIGQEAGASAVSGFVFSQAVPVATALSQGCIPMGPMHEISAADEHVIAYLDGRVPFDVFSEDMRAMAEVRLGYKTEELLAKEGAPLPANLLQMLEGQAHVAFPVSGTDQMDFLVRNIMAIDPDTGMIAVGEAIEDGRKMMFVHRDDETVRADLTQTLVALQKRILHDTGSFTPRGALYVSCVARSHVSFAKDGKAGGEMALLREILGDIPITGFYANGEISNNRLYGYTGVLTLFL